nr:hypothetical protein [Tanacetum cinerariifolium]
MGRDTLEFTSEYGISEAMHPELPGPEDRIVDFSEGKIGVYTKFFEFANFRLPLSQFLFDILCYYQIHLSQLSVIGAAKNNRFFWVDERVFPTVVDWRTSAPKDRMPAENTYSSEAVRILDTHRTPIQKQPEALLCLVGLSRRYYLGDEVYPTFLHDDDRVKTGSLPSAAHEVPLQTMTATRVVEVENPATATDSSGVPSTIERSPLDFANEAGPEDHGTMAPEVPLPDDVSTTRGASEASQTESVAATAPPVIIESRKRSSDGVDANTPPKVLRRDHADPRPSRRDPKSENTSFASMVGSPESIYLPEWGIANGSMLDTPEACQDLVDHVAPPGGDGVTAMTKVRRGSKTAEEIYLQVSNNRLSQQVATLQEQVSGEEKLKAAFEEFKQYEDSRVDDRTRAALAVMKCGESLELRQVFADVVSAGVAKGMSEGLRHGVEHRQAQLNLESIEAYDPEAKAKYIAALQALKDLKYPLADQLEGLKDAPMDVIMAALYLESDTRDDVPQRVRDLRPTVWRRRRNAALYAVRHTHRISSVHHARSDDVPVSAPTVVPQGLAILLADVATQTKSDEATLNNFYVLHALWESLRIPNVLGMALRTQSPGPPGLQPVYAADHV